MAQTNSLPRHPLPDERLYFETRLHGIVFAAPVSVFLVALAVGLVGWWTLHRTSYPATAVIVAAGLFVLPPYLMWRTTELGVTDRRVVIRTGFIRRRSLDIALAGVESVRVEQGILGRLLDYGTVTISGTGGTHERFRSIAAPFAFQRAVQNQRAGVNS